ncbi:putative reverse transcriptase domain-containing protein [Tanacetum coccineum]
MTKLTQKNVKFVWGDKQEAAFQLLKQKLCGAPILALPEGSEDFITYCDASKKGLGAVLMQREKETNIQEKDEKRSQNDKTKHGNVKSVKSQSQSRSKSKSQQKSTPEKSKVKPEAKTEEILNGPPLPI